jgi:nucleotide-binding universal stress UspA family protein
MKSGLPTEVVLLLPGDGAGGMQRGPAMVDVPKNILAPTDFSSVSKSAAAYAGKLAVATRSTLHLHHFVPDVMEGKSSVETPHLGHALDDTEKEGKANLEELLTEDERAKLSMTSYVGFGPPVNEITDYAAKNGIDLIVMATHGRSGLEKM